MSSSANPQQALIIPSHTYGSLQAYTFKWILHLLGTLSNGESASLPVLTTLCTPRGQSLYTDLAGHILIGAKNFTDRHYYKFIHFRD